MPMTTATFRSKLFLLYYYAIAIALLNNGEFYRHWQQQKLDKAQALRHAMLTTMQQYPNPKNWAAFTLIGEP